MYRLQPAHFSRCAHSRRGSCAAFESTVSTSTCHTHQCHASQGYSALPELRQLWSSSPRTVQPLVTALSAALVRETARAAPQLAHYFAPHGLDVAAWLRGDVPSPPVDGAWLRSAPVSFPLIGLTQLAAYAAVAEAMGLDAGDAAAPGDDPLRRLSVGAIGHSQGVVIAAAVASAGSASELAVRGAAALSVLLWTGVHMQVAADALPRVRIKPTPAKGAPRRAADDSEQPTSMLAVSGLGAAELKAHVDAANSAIARAEKAAAAAAAAAAAMRGAAASDAPPTPPAALPALNLALVNGGSSCVVSGAAGHLAFLVSALDAVRAEPGVDQARVPFSQRRPVVSTRYLRVSAPFHSALMAEAPAAIAADVAAGGYAMPRSALMIPVYSTADGADLRAAGSEGDDLVLQLAKLQCVQPVDWPAVVSAALLPAIGAGPRAQPRATHVLDFGPGGASGSARMTARCAQGAGVVVIVATPAGGVAPPLADAEQDETAASPSRLPATLFDGDAADPLPLHDVGLAVTTDASALAAAAAPNWAASHAPRLVRRATDGALLLDTRYSRLLGRAPVVVGGMTPCTSYYGTRLVAAIANGGFSAELAGGGLPRPAIFAERIARVHALLAPGTPIALNLLYLNAKQWGFQFPAVAQLRSEGAPLEGVTIGAGVPSPDTAAEIVAVLRGAGLRFLAFKPGSLDAIRRVADIAAAAAPYPIVLQWTGGRAGGHHSFEDVHVPMLAAYAQLRRHANLVSAPSRRVSPPLPDTRTHDPRLHAPDRCVHTTDPDRRLWPRLGRVRSSLDDR